MENLKIFIYNNNGQKIHNTLATYKMAARDYIYGVDKNMFYKNFKLKLESLFLIVNKQNIKNNHPASRIFMTDQFKMITIDDNEGQEFLRSSLTNYKIDWM